LVVVAVPFLRPVRAMRTARGLRLLRAARIGAYLGRGLHGARVVLRQHHLNYVLLMTLAAVFGGAALVESLEAGLSGASITSFSDALWWSASTVTTVGYGDEVPTTAAGRGVGLVLMVLGIALFGLLTASLASYFVDNKQDEVHPQWDELKERLARMEDLLRRAAVEDNKERP
jgi:voltage-gated potassium channel